MNVARWDDLGEDKGRFVPLVWLGSTFRLRRPFQSRRGSCENGR